jgi:hypothetical protein
MSIDDTTNQLFALAQQSLGYASGSAGRINVSAKPTLKETPFSYTVGNINLQEPPKFSDLFGGTDNAAVNIASVNGDVDAWMAKYFPSINSGFEDVPEDYLVRVISGVKPFGSSQNVFDTVWHESRSRAERTVRSERATLATGFASRGMTLPPGAIESIVAQSDCRLVNAVLDVNREQAIKGADIKLQLLQQAVQLATQLKLGILNAAADMFRVYTSMYQLDTQSAQTKALAYHSFYNALSSFYSVEVNLEQLKLRAAETKAGVDSGIDKNRISNHDSKSTSKGHAEAAGAFASIASGAAGAAGTLEAHITSGKPTP